MLEFNVVERSNKVRIEKCVLELIRRIIGNFNKKSFIEVVGGLR